MEPVAKVTKAARLSSGKKKEGGRSQPNTTTGPLAKGGCSHSARTALSIGANISFGRDRPPKRMSHKISSQRGTILMFGTEGLVKRARQEALSSFFGPPRGGFS